MKVSKIQKEFGTFGSKGTANKMKYSNFESFAEAKEYFQQNKIILCGVEIGPQSESILKHSFRGDTVFLLGNEGQGLLDVHKQYCDHFVYIPQYSFKTASLNVAIAGSIIFHHFAVWAGFQEYNTSGEKFQESNDNAMDKEEFDDHQNKQVKYAEQKQIQPQP